MAGRGRSRGRSRGILDVEFSTPGGLAQRNKASDEEDEDGKLYQDTSKPAEKEAGTNDASRGQGNTSTSGVATLSLEDMKSILEDTRTYSDQNDVKRVLLCARNFVRTEEDVQTLASLIYNKCMEDSSLAKRGSEICDGLTSIEIGNTKFRSCLLSMVQSDYKARNEVIATEPSRFSCFLAFLCEIFAIMRTATDEVFKPLITPIFDCFNLILGPEDPDDETVGGESNIVNDDACEIFAIQLQSVGRLLEENGEEQMKHLMDRIRTCIINSRSSPRVRCSLLEVLECYARGWESANNETTRFYCDMAVGIISGLVL